MQVLTLFADGSEEKEIPQLGNKTDGGPQIAAEGALNMAWTGKIVSLAEWRGMSDWERHGSTGKMYCGVCREWLVDCDHIEAAKGLDQ